MQCARRPDPALFPWGAGAGHILIDGTDVADSTIAELSKTIGLVFQNPFNQLSYTAGTVAEELAYGLGNHGVPRAQMIDRVEAVAKLMRIDHIPRQEPAGTVGWTGCSVWLPDPLSSWNRAFWCL